MSTEETMSNAGETIATEEQTLTLDGVIYRMSDLPANGVVLLNDLIRSENEANEFRYRLRQIAGAQQSLTAALKHLIAEAGIAPIASSNGIEDSGDSGADDQLAA